MRVAIAVAAVSTGTTALPLAPACRAEIPSLAADAARRRPLRSAATLMRA